MMRKLYRKVSLTAALLLMFTSALLAQERTVSGTVTDETGGAMPGVNVLVKGTSTGTASDSDGNFKISIENDNSVLLFTFVGYATAEVVVGSRSVVNVQLTPDVRLLTELVVTGYTSQRKADITGAVTVVDADQLKDAKAANVGQMLAGRAAGVTVSNSGEPGSGSNIRIRGVSSFGSSDPLIIVDGIQLQGDKSLNALNPNDIESMQVLKDAGAASIYGSRASAGVIIITTKKGKVGTPRITYDGYVGSQAPVGGYNDFLIKDPEDYARWQVMKDPSTVPFYGGNANNPVIPEYFYAPPGWGGDEDDYFPPSPTNGGYLIMKSNQNGTDWWDETFRNNALIMDHNIGISGGTDKATYSGSVGYFKQEGTMIHTNFERFSARLNSQATAGRFTIGENIAFSRMSGVTMAGGSQNEQNNMTQILKLNSIVPVYDIGGNFAGAKQTGFSNGSNPVAMATRNKDNQQVNYRLLGSFFAEIKITDWLKAKTNFAIDYSNNFAPNFSYARWENREVNSTVSYSENWSTGMNWTWTNMLEFSKKFGKHNVSAFVGYEANEGRNRNINASMVGYFSYDVRHRYLSEALGDYNTLVSRQTIGTLVSTFGKVDYDFNDRILASFTVRRDGSSNFVTDKYGVFPAFTLGYRITEEAFMSDISWLSDLKIRGGWGVMGNQRMPGTVSYNTYDQYGSITPFFASYDINGTNTSAAGGLTRTQIGNPSTSWEENTTTNIGFDAVLLDGKFTAVLDVYKKEVDDLLFGATLPGPAGVAPVPVSNVASMTNTGFDLSLGYKGNITSDLDLTVDLNLSHYKNEINSLDGSTQSLFPGGIDKRFGEVNIWKVGQPIGTYYGYQVDGILQSQDEIDDLNAGAIAATGDPTSVYQAGMDPGRFKWKDLNKDGRITDADQGVIGNYHPSLTMGLNIGLNYKAFDFTMYMFGSFGQEIFNYNKLFTVFGQFASNVDERVLTDSWSSENPGGSLPEVDVDDTYSNLSSDFYVEKGSYLRAAVMTLGYTIPVANKIGLQKARVYVQGSNLFTITKYSGIDPALSSVNIANNQGNNDGWAGYDFGNYPASKSVVLGLNISF